MPKCDQCARDFPEKELRTCEYCRKKFCSECYYRHMSWELRHKSLVEDTSKLWKRKRKGTQESIS